MKLKPMCFFLGVGLVCAVAIASASVPPGVGQSGRQAEIRRALAAYRLRSLSDASGHYNARLVQAGLVARQRLLQAQKAVPQGTAAALTVNWTEIGPGNVGGRINTIWIDPSNGQHLIIGTAGGGLWQSLDGGQSWAAVTGFPGTLAVGALVQVSANTLLAGTGDQFNEPQPGIGLVISTDGGNTWMPVSSTGPSSSNPDWYYVNSLAISSGGVILAAVGDVGTPSDLLNSTEPGVGYGGIWRSTNGGQTWNKVWPTAGGENPSYDVIFDPNNPNVAVADTDTGTVVYSADGGATWNLATGLPKQNSLGYRVSLAFDASTAGSVYALVDNAPSSGSSGEVFHSTDGGKTWSLLAGTSAFVNSNSGTAVGALCDSTFSGPAECQGDYDNVMAVFPQGTGKAPFIVVGGIDVFASTDGGATWSMVGNPYGNSAALYLHADQHAIATNGNYYYIGNDGGMYEQKAGSPYNWVAINSGLAITQFYRIDGHNGVTASKNAPGGVPITPILAGSQDNGMQLYLGYSASGAPQPNNWAPFLGGDGVAALVDPADGNFLYGEYPYLSISYSTTGGPSGQYFAVEPPDNTATPQTANFISPIALVPSGTQAANQMLAGGASLWLGNNIQSGNPSWSSLNGATLPVGTGGNYISAIEIDPNNNNNIWVGYDDGEIWHTTNATSSNGPTWAKTASSTGQQVTSIWVVPGNSSAVYATYAGFPSSGGNVWETTNGGQTWTAIGTTLPPGPVYTLVTDPNYPQILYVGTYTGVYTSLNNGSSWSASNVGPGNIAVNQLSWFDKGSPPILLAATDGRGAWLGSPAYNPTPVLTGLSPSQVTAGSGATTITLNGNGFALNAAVNLDGSPVNASVVSSTQIQATLPATEFSVAGTHVFTVVNPIPGGGTSAGATLAIVNPQPTISSLSPSSIQAGNGAFTLTVTGSGFVPSSVVQWNGNPLSTTFGSGTSLAASVPASDVAAASSVTVSVFNPAPGGGTSGGVAFTITAPPTKGGGGGLDGWSLVALAMTALGDLISRRKPHFKHAGPMVLRQGR